MSQLQYTNSFGKTYYLNAKDVRLRGGRDVTVYFFSVEPGRDTAVDNLPKGKTVRENPRNGFLAVVDEECQHQKHIKYKNCG